ncbi:MAG: lamin tail domain-containing protein [Anaerolineales bacterium]|nr:lamin tail domain-containing protein [Anaerolineales bacterium]
MDRKNKLWPFILLNIVVSAVTMSIVLLIWSRVALRNTVDNPALPTPQSNQTISKSTNEPESGVDSFLEYDWVGKLEIITVTGLGDLETERVRLQYNGEGEAMLLGWMLQDEDNNNFTFPALRLHDGAVVTIYTKSGEDTVFELYWNQSKSVWRSGEEVTLVDPDGKAYTQYLIP